MTNFSRFLHWLMLVYIVNYDFLRNEGILVFLRVIIYKFRLK